MLINIDISHKKKISRELRIWLTRSIIYSLYLLSRIFLTGQFASTIHIQSECVWLHVQMSHVISNVVIMICSYCS